MLHRIHARDISMPDKKLMELAIEAYSSGASIPMSADKYGVSRSTLRRNLSKAGVLRTRSEGVRLAAAEGRLGSGMRGKSRVFTEEHKNNISTSRLRWGEENADGLSCKANGYVEYTRGPNKGRSVHVVKMEERIGRPLRNDECVHHIDRDRHNNTDDNLALVTRSGHARLHRFEDSLEGKKRERKKNGTWR